MAKAIIFDLQGTLLENGVFPSPVKQARFILNVRARFHDYITVFEQTLMTKHHKNLNEAFSAVAESFSIRLHPVAAEKLVGMWNKNKLLSKPFPETMELLEELHKTHKLILVANIDNLSKDVIEKFSLQKYFDHVFLSCDVGMLKTDAGFYSHVLKECALDKKDVLLVGDSVDSDMRPAESAGIECILVDRNNRMEYEKKVSNLRELDL